ncbi:MAG: hypothetical protein GY778_08275 [bacterium]|nr:hypothetical protein [bacterium]
MPTTTRTLTDFLAELDEYPGSIPLDHLISRLGELAIGLDDVSPFARFGRESYQRNLMHAGPGYHALVLCWRAGQRSPIHDHNGSACGVRVIKGVGTETRFERTPEGLIFPTDTRTVETGAVCGSFDQDLHQVSNLQPASQDLITLHIYSPPLLRMGVYSLTDSKVTDFLDPIVGLEDGDGI